MIRSVIYLLLLLLFLYSITQSATMIGQDITVIIVFFFCFFVVCSIVDDHSLLLRGVHHLDVVNDEGGLTIAAPLERGLVEQSDGLSHQLFESGI